MRHTELVETETEVPLFWLLGTLLPITLNWMGLVVVFVLVFAAVAEVFCRRQVRSRLRAIDCYLPSPTPWQRSAGMVCYNTAYVDPVRR